MSGIISGRFDKFHDVAIVPEDTIQIVIVPELTAPQHHFHFHGRNRSHIRQYDMVHKRNRPHNRGFAFPGVKLSFYARESKAPVMRTIPFMNHIVLADMGSIAAMKMEVMLRRSKFRDYYDLYCIFRNDGDVMKFVKAAGDYSGHLLKSKNILRSQAFRRGS